MRYSVKSELAKRICNEIEWYFDMQALEAGYKNGIIHVRGTLLKPNEAKKLEYFCNQKGYKYHGPYAN